MEGLLAGERPDLALPVLETLAQEVLVDVDWLEHCPLMEQLRDEARMVDVRTKVRARARAIWSMT